MSLSLGRLYLDSARHMRWSQVAGRVRRLVPVAAIAASARPRGDVSIRPIAAGVGVDPAPASGPAPRPDVTGKFSAAGAERPVGHPGFWTDESDGLYFLFHLHGFAPLAAYVEGERTEEGDRFWRDVVESWLASCGTPGLPAWHPYPTSVRLISWSAALSALTDWPPALRSRLASEVVRQGRYLRRAVEHDIGGNHVLKNAAALVIAGATIPACGTLERGLTLLRRELARQILSDGGHEERSPSYHRAVSQDLLDVVTVLQHGDHVVPEWLEQARGRMGQWLGELAGPDGRLPLLNDAWEGPPVSGRVASDVTELAESGYVVLRHHNDQAVLDCGPISPPHLPPHAHADVLSFVLWGDGAPLVVDPGSYSYTGPSRDRFRGTLAHNTVEVDGRDQCEFWGDFRAAFHPRVRSSGVERRGEAVVVVARHDGYRRLPDPVEHERTFVWWPGSGLVVIDRLLATTRHQIRSSIHLAPGRDQREGCVGEFVVSALGPGATARSRPGAYAPWLGTTVPTAVLEDVRAVEPETLFGWSVLRDGASVQELSPARIVLVRPGGRLELALCGS